MEKGSIQPSHVGPSPSGLRLLVRFQFFSMVMSGVKFMISVSMFDQGNSMQVSLTLVELLGNTAGAGDDVVTEQDSVGVVVGAVGGVVVDV